MNSLILCAGLILGSVTVPDGSLLFLENSNRFVELYTGSGTTHVAIVLNDGDQSFVYEATPGEVRKLPLNSYYEELGRLNERRSAERKIRVFLMRPREAYTEAQVAAMRAALEAEVGRRYSIKGYVRGESDGMHCAELAARALCAATVLDLPRCQDESPASLLEKIESRARPKAVIQLEEPIERDAWLTRRSYDWSRFTNWCQWSCWETWTWCW